MDEYLYWLWPNELQTHIPIIERLMIDGMKTVIPDVKVGVESSCMLHWDKKATEFTKIQWTEDGLPILEEPPFVRELNKALEAQKETTLCKERTCNLQEDRPVAPSCHS